MHLWVVLHVYVPDLEFDEWAVIALVTSTTARTTQDLLTCQVGNGDHPYLVHGSYVLYQATAQYELAKLPEGCRHQPCSAALLERIQRGAHASRHTQRGMKKLVPNP